MSTRIVENLLLWYTPMTMVDRIKALAKQQGIGLAELENKLGFGFHTIYKWDKSSPSANKLSDVANFLHCSMDYLYTGEERPSLSDEDQELLDIFHSLPPETQRDFLGAMRIHAELHDLVDMDDEPEENDLKQAK